MPALVAMAEHKGRGADWLSDIATVDQPSTGLVASPEERVRRASDSELSITRLLENGSSGVDIYGKGLLRVDMLTRLDDVR